ncbi:MAG: hypothetical protein V1907_04200 [Candidatus Kerfeldbacteria bacterium]
MTGAQSNNPMHITFITTSIHQKKEGVEKHVLPVACELMTRGHSISVLAFRVQNVKTKELIASLRLKEPSTS